MDRIVVALNKVDLLEKDQVKEKVSKLGKMLKATKFGGNSPIVPMSATVAVEKGMEEGGIVAFI
jgi:translation initiation factor 2 gamma subunit (eIF-2gamma)